MQGYFLMCFGCIAHMGHGHHKKKVAPTPTIDPVRGLQAEESQEDGKLQKSILMSFHIEYVFEPHKLLMI